MTRPRQPEHAAEIDALWARAKAATDEYNKHPFAGNNNVTTAPCRGDCEGWIIRDHDRGDDGYCNPCANKLDAGQQPTDDRGT